MRVLGIPALTPEWFAARQGAITATDVPKILGQSDWGTALDVWGRITGNIPPVEEDVEKKPWLEWGNRTEDMHRRWVADEAGLIICESPGLVQHPEIPYLLATPDGFYATPDEIGALRVDDAGKDYAWEGVFETKAPSPFTSFDPKEEVPLAYQVQVQVQLAVCGLDKGIISSLHWPGPKWAFLDAHPGFQERALNIIGNFWDHHVQKDIPPEATHKDIKILERLFPEADGTVLHLGNNCAADAARWQELSESLSTLNQTKKILDEERAGCRARIVAEMGPATFGVLGETIFKSAYTERPAYEVQAKRFRTFRTVKEI